MAVEQITKHIADAWTWVKAVDPAWVSAIAAVIAVTVALGVVVRWCVLRRDLRGSGAAIIALLGESDHEAFASFKGRGWTRGIEHSSEVVYFAVGSDHYFLCKRDLERLHALGYVYREERKYHLSRLGRLLLEKHDNARLLAKGVARAKRGGYLRCNGRLWLRCRCEKYRLAGCVPFLLRTIGRQRQGTGVTRVAGRSTPVGSGSVPGLRSGRRRPAARRAAGPRTTKERSRPSLPGPDGPGRTSI